MPRGRRTNAKIMQDARERKNADPKRRLLRRADSERETAYSVGGQTTLVEKRPITLPRLKFMEKPFHE